MQRKLLTDPRVLLLAAALLSVVALYFLPAFSSQAWMERKALVLTPVMVVATVLAVLLGNRSIADLEERRFWRRICLAHGSYLAGFFYLGPELEARHATFFSIYEDTTILGYYAFLFLAIVASPHLGRRSTAGATIARVRTVGSLVFVFGMLVYFIVIPAAAGRETHEDYIPTLFLFAGLDLLALILLLGLAFSVRSARWRRIYGLFVANVALWFVLDLSDSLIFAGVLPYAEQGSPFELAWSLPYLLVVAAALQKAPERASKLPAQAPERALTRPHLAPLVLFVAAVPLVHICLYGTSFAVQSVRSQREACVLVLVVVLGGLALLEHRHQERERQRIQAQMLQSQKMESLGTLAGGIAHSFNNLLTVILGRTQLALADEPEERADRADLEAVLGAGLRARDLVRQILAFSRQRTPTMEPIPIEDEVRSALAIARASVPSNVELREDIQRTPGDVLADPSQLHQVVLNLCSNAFHAVRAEGGWVEVSLRVAHDSLEAAGPFVQEGPGAIAHLTVRDNGVGMVPALSEHVFEPFFTTKPPGEGTGLGLSVVYGVVSEAGGSVALDSAPGKGTTVDVLLPLSQQRAATAPPTPAPARAVRRHVMVVDDELENTVVLQRMLESLGFSAEAFTDPRRAREAFRMAPASYDLVITDEVMPDLSGRELARDVLELRADVGVLLCTGYAEVSRHLRSDDAMQRPVLDKPVLFDELVGAIRDTLGPAADPA